jgi:hypothetical protein
MPFYQGGARLNGENAPDALVQDGKLILGSWKGIPGKANLLDTKRPYHYPLPLFLKRLRLKEWRAIQAGDSSWFMMVVLYDAKFLSMASIDLWDKANKRKFGLRHIFPGSRFTISENLLPSHTQAHTGRDIISMSINSDLSVLKIRASSMSRKRNGESDLNLDLELPLSKDTSSAFSVCLPFGLNRAMYSTKMLSSCSGMISVQGQDHHFDPASSIAVFDDHKGYYPYRLHYDWATGFGIDRAGRRVGFNLTDNQVKDQVKYNENRLWIGTDVFALPPIKITRPYGNKSAWIIQDTEGMVDLVFIPEVSHDIRMKMGIADIDYVGPFGRFEGSIHSSLGDKIDASVLYGMGEDKNVRL